ncbi:hypothetical protein TNCV_4389331 [Trichonephila clavipes]|nr:hypothetical protein TNCV_4389331 [Trichonephila clavipes]
MNFVDLDLTSLESSPPGVTKAYQLLLRSINRQVANGVAKNDTNLALSPAFGYASIESPLLSDTGRPIDQCSATFLSVRTGQRLIILPWPAEIGTR